MRHSHPIDPVHWSRQMMKTDEFLRLLSSLVNPRYSPDLANHSRRSAEPVLFGFAPRRSI